MGHTKATPEHLRPTLDELRIHEKFAELLSNRGRN